MPSILSMLKGARPQATTSSPKAAQPKAAPAVSPKPQPVTSRTKDVFTGSGNNVVRQPGVQPGVNSGLRMTFGVNPAALAQRLQAAVTAAQTRAQAEADMAALLKRKPPAQAGDFVALLAQHSDDPEYAAYLVGAAASEDSQFFLQGPVLSGLNEVRGIGGADGQQLLLAAIKLARDHQPPLLDMEMLEMSPEYTADIINGMNRITDPAAAFQTLATESIPIHSVALQSLTATAETQHQRLEELDGQLARQLTQFGPGLTEEQRAAYIEAFKARHPEYAEAAAADQAVADYLQTHQQVLQQAVLHSDDTQIVRLAAQALSSGYQALAGTEHNQLVLDALLVPELLPALAEYHPDGPQAFHDEVVAPTGQHCATTAGTGINPETVLQQLVTLYTNVKAVPELADQATTALTAFGQLGDALRELRQTGDGRAFGEVLNTISEEAGNTSPLGKLLVGGGFLMGVAMIAEGMGQGGAGGHELAMQGLMQSLQNPAAIGYGLELMAEHYPNAVSAELAKHSVEVLEKVTDYLGLITSSLAFFDSMTQVDTTSGKMNAFSNFLNVVGGVAVVAGANVLGAVATMLSIGTSLLSGAIADLEQKAKNAGFDAETWSILTDPSFQPPVDPSLLQMLKELPPGSAQLFSDQFGLTPQQFISYVQNDPDVLHMLAEVAAGSVGPKRFEQLAELGVTFDQLAQLANSDINLLSMLTMSTDTSLDTLAALQSQLGLKPEETFQLVMDMATHSSISDMAIVLDRVFGTLRHLPEGANARDALEQLLEEVSPSERQALQLILEATQP